MTGLFATVLVGLVVGLGAGVVAAAAVGLSRGARKSDASRP
jgi:MFS superfamily sulfate permease-like transporter